MFNRQQNKRAKFSLATEAKAYEGYFNVRHETPRVRHEWQVNDSVSVCSFGCNCIYAHMSAYDPFDESVESINLYSKSIAVC